MSELAWTVAVIAVPFLWTQYRRIQNNRAHRALVAQIERQQRQDSQPPPSILTAATLNHSAAPVVGPAGPASSAKQRLTPTLQFILVCLIIHEGWIIWEIVYDQPINIFVAMDVPVTTLVSKLKKLLLEFSDAPTLPPHLNFLLLRLQSFDTRTYYVRYGHHIVVSCAWCQGQMDYLLYYVAHVTIEYIRTAGLMAIMTMKGSGKRKWRKWSLAIVLGALIAEVWTVALMDVTIPRDGSECQMLADNIFNLRHIVFFFVPLVIHFLPYSFLPISPFNPLGPLSLLLARVNERLTFFSVLQAASQRHPVLLERRTEYWRNQAEEAGWARGEEEVMSEAERSGLGYREESHGEGPAGIRQSTRMRVMEMKHMLERLRPIMAPSMPQETTEAFTNGDAAAVAAAAALGRLPRAPSMLPVMTLSSSQDSTSTSTSSTTTLTS